MEINKVQNESELSFFFSGRLDTVTAPRFEEEVKSLPETVTELIIDMQKLEYISSAGLRVLLAAEKKMRAKGRMLVRNVCPEIMEIFDITGFTDILNIE